MLHLTPWNKSDLKIGNTYCTPNGLSNYWKNKLNKTAFIGFDEKLSPILNIFNRIGMPADLNDSFKNILIEIKYKSELLKEIIFEEHRKEFYEDRPSRNKCMFCFPDAYNPDTIRVLFNLSIELRPTIIKLEAVANKSKFFLTDAKYLNCNTSDYHGMIEHADIYWKGNENPDMPEILFEGEYVLNNIL